MAFSFTKTLKPLRGVEGEINEKLQVEVIKKDASNRAGILT